MIGLSSPSPPLFALLLNVSINLYCQRQNTNSHFWSMMTMSSSHWYELTKLLIFNWVRTCAETPRLYVAIGKSCSEVFPQNRRQQTDDSSQRPLALLRNRRKYSSLPHYKQVVIYYRECIYKHIFLQCSVSRMLLADENNKAYVPPQWRRALISRRLRALFSYWLICSVAATSVITIASCHLSIVHQAVHQ